MDKPVDPVMACGLAQCLGRELDKETFSDFTVRVEDEDFKCHKVVLSACSGFFAGMFRSNMKEQAEGKVLIKGMTPKTFWRVLDAIYKGVNVLDEKNIYDIWNAAHLLQIEFLMNACEEYAMAHISVDNCMEVHAQATLLQSMRVLNAVRQMMIRDFEPLMRSSVLPKIPFDDLFHVIGSPDIQVCPDGLVQAVLSWVSGMNFDDIFGKQPAPSSQNVASPEEVAATAQIKRKNLRTKAGQASQKSKQRHLKTLLMAAKIERVSHECLSFLMTHEILRRCNDALHHIIEIAAKRLNPQVASGVYQPRNCGNRMCPFHYRRC